MRLNSGPRIQPFVSARGLVCLLLLALLLCVVGALKSPAANQGEAPATGVLDAGAVPGTPGQTPSPAASRRSRQEDLDAPGPGAQYVGSAFCGAPACHGAMM